MNKAMKAIQIYDPPMCCSTGICGTDIAPDLVNFAGMLAQLKQRGISIERYNLAQQPVAFAQNDDVKHLLQSAGEKALPLIFWDGTLKMQGRYPTRDERSEWVRAALESGTEGAV